MLSWGGCILAQTELETCGVHAFVAISKREPQVLEVFKPRLAIFFPRFPSKLDGGGIFFLRQIQRV
jgi:hypothetical protein